MSKREFSILKVIVSNWYTKHRCLNMLKMLFRDMVDNVKLAGITNTIDLMNELVIKGKMSAKDLTLLYDTIRITGQFGLQTEIKEILPSFPDLPDVKRGTLSTHFTAYRQKLMVLGEKLTKKNVEQIDGLYNIPRKMYEDSWSMITDLEENKKISEKEMEEFIDSMKILELNLALDALKDIKRE